MAFLECHVFSKSLFMATSFSACLPNDVMERPEQGFPVVYLLHGYSDDHTIWARRTCVDRYAEERGIAVIMPEVQHSFYADMKYGMKYFEFVSEELPKLCRGMFGLSPRREDTFVAGLSMGGYGALKCGLSRPDVFSACVGLSASADIVTLLEKREPQNKEFVGIFGDKLEITEKDDLFALAKSAEQLPKDSRPRVMTCCGTEDFLYDDNKKFKEFMEKSDLSYRYMEGTGVHDWVFWEKMIRPTLDFCLEGRKGG